MSRDARSAGIGRSPARPRRSLLDRLWGLLSLLILLALLVGVPAALIALRGKPLPDAGLNPGAMYRALTSPDDGSLFLAALTWLAWAGWATFAVSVLVEIPAHVRGLPSPQLPALGLQQRAASSLLAGAALLFTLPTLSFPVMATDARPAAAVSTTLNHIEATGTPADAPTQSVVTAATGPNAPTYIVQPGDSLWQIAHDYLGDGARYPEIARLNYGAHQLDGRTLTSDHWLHPGWTLTLPPNATAHPTADPSPAVVVVAPGDTLWDIAQETLRDGSRYDEIAAASTDLQADGRRLTDPDLIRPGWHLTVPSTPASAPTLGDSPARKVGGHSPAGAPADKVPHAVRPGVPARAIKPVLPPSLPSAAAEPVIGEHSTPPTQQNVPRQHLDDIVADGVVVRTAAGIGALLAAGLLVVLGAKRARQQRRRRPGQRIAMPPPDLATAELSLRNVEDPTGLAQVDQALRTLSLLLGQAGRVLPSLRLVRLTAQQIELYLTEPAVLPAPFTGTGDPTIWTLDGDATLPPSSALKAVPAPYPSLVTVGHDLDDAHLLLDLECVRALAVDGDPESCLAIMAAIAAELATSSWADDLQITVIGCLPTLSAALGDSRVRYLPTLEEQLPALEHRTADVRAALRSNGLGDLHHARTANAAQHLHGNAWTPEILLLNGPIAPDARARFDAILHDLPHVGVAAITTGCDGLGEWTLRLGGGASDEVGLAELTPIGLALRPQRLAAADLDQLLALFTIADQPAVSRPGCDEAPGPTDVDELTLTDLGSHLDTFLTSRTTGPEKMPGAPGANDDTTASCAVIDIDNPPASTTAVEEPASNTSHPGITSVADTTPNGQAPSDPPPPMVQILGPVEILRPRGAVEPSKRRQLTEIAAYLALHPGSDHYGLSEAIWPGSRAVDNTRHTALSKLRKWLGTSEVGIDYVPRVVEDGYRLHPDVRTDWQLWQALLPDGPGSAGTGALAAALDLVKGKPFAGTNPRRYAWAERDRQDMISAIVDVAHELARRALLDADATLARGAAAAGLQADPGAELLWRDALKAEWLAGDREGLVSTADRLSALAEELDDDLEPETIELLEELLRRPARRVGGR